MWHIFATVLYNFILILQIIQQERGYYFSVKSELMLTVISKRIWGADSYIEKHIGFLST